MFGDNLRKYRIEKGLSQNDIAEKLFVSRQCVSKWEKGVTQPDLQTLAQISELLEVSVDMLVKDDDSSRASAPDRNAQLFTANVLIAAFCIISFIIVWRFLPLNIPAHWTGGTIDRYGNRNEIFINIIAPTVFLIVDLLIFFALKRVSDRRVACFAHGAIAIFQIAYLIFIIAMYAEYLSSAVSLSTCMCADLILCVSTAMHPKINKQNSIIGIRTAETLKSKTVWNKTNALGCYLFTGCSLVILAVNMALTFALAALCLSAYLIPTITVIAYSKIIYKNSDE